MFTTTPQCYYCNGFKTKVSDGWECQIPSCSTQVTKPLSYLLTTTQNELKAARQEIVDLKSECAHWKMVTLTNQRRLDAQGDEIYILRAKLLTLKALAPDVYRSVEEAANNPVNIETEI